MFDRIIVVDWSANSAPKRGSDSIWAASFDGDAPDGRAINLATREQALAHLEELIPGQRTLLAVDFSLGYPRGTAAALGIDGSAWEGMWSLLDELVIDDHRNANNRFEVAAELNGRITRRFPGGDGPFWGCPHTRDIEGLTTTKVPCEPLPEWRHTEARLRSLGLRPFSSWQLLGAGSVGSQSLLGIAALARLRRRLRVDVEVWPFSTGLRVPATRGDGCVVVEAWPSMVSVVDGERVHDEAQVLTLGAHLFRAAQSGALADWFAPWVPDGQRAAVVDEEGWVLGAGVHTVER